MSPDADAELVKVRLKTLTATPKRRKTDYPNYFTPNISISRIEPSDNYMYEVDKFRYMN
jgi:hypothetical protein